MSLTEENTQAVSKVNFIYFPRTKIESLYRSYINKCAGYFPYKIVYKKPMLWISHTSDIWHKFS